MKRYFIILFIGLLSVTGFSQITNALQTFDKHVGKGVSKTFSQFGEYIDFSYYNKDSARYDYLTVKIDGTIFCQSHDIDTQFPTKIMKQIEVLFPKELKKELLGNYRIGIDTKGKPVYIFMLVEKDTIVFLDDKGTVLQEIEME